MAEISSGIGSRPELVWETLKSGADGTSIATVGYCEKFLTREEADRAFEELDGGTSIRWERIPIKLWGKQMVQPRDVAFFNKDGKSYPYSASVVLSQNWFPKLDALEKLVSGYVGSSLGRDDLTFDSILCNRYNSGSDHISPHADDDPFWGKEPVIASLSLGGTRKFNVAEVVGPGGKLDARGKREYALGHGSLLVMMGLTQETCKHWVPKTKDADPRINLTMRTWVAEEDYVRKKKKKKDPVRGGSRDAKRIKRV